MSLSEISIKDSDRLTVVFENEDTGCPFCVEALSPTMAKSVENRQMLFPFSASSSSGVSTSSSSSLSCCPPVFPPCLPSSIIDRLVDEAGHSSSKIEDGKASSRSSGRPKGDERSPVEDICGDGSVLLLRIQSKRGELPRFQRQEGSPPTGVTDAEGNQQEEAINERVEGQRPSCNIEKAEVPGVKKNLDQRNARGDPQPLEAEKAGRGEAKTEGREENVGEEEILANSGEEKQGQQESRPRRHCTRQPDNLGPWPGCLACISAVVSAVEEDPSFSPDRSVHTLRQSDSKPLPSLKV